MSGTAIEVVKGRSLKRAADEGKRNPLLSWSRQAPPSLAGATNDQLFEFNNNF
jgi:hypothetical protein